MLIPEKWRLRAAVLLLTIGLPAIAAAQMPNLTYYYHPNFTYPLTPTNTPVTTWPVVLSPTLQGNADATYLSYAMQNNGTALAYDIWFEHLWVDGEAIDIGINANLPAGSTSMTYGYGPTNVRGGRHTLGFTVDTFDEISESDETDNAWAHQFVFTPYVLSVSTPKNRGAPPFYFGGVSSIVDGSPVDYNSDGFRFSSTGWWNAITMYAQDDMDDYELGLYPPSTGSEDGFIGAATISAVGAGFLEAVIVNRNTVSIQDYDVGVSNYNEGTSHFVIEQVVSEPAWVGDSITAALAVDEYLRIWDAYFGDTGWFTVSVTVLSPGDETFIVALIEQDATEIGLYEITEVEFINDEGKAWLHKEISTTGYYGLVVYRNPIGGGLAKTIQIDIQPTTPDLKPFQSPGWHAPLVPTPVPQTGNPVVLPDTLHGFMPENYFNFAVENDSPVGAPGVNVAIVKDGGPWVVPYMVSPLSGFGTFGFQENFGREVPGGRHVLALDVDYTDSIQEFNEGNNTYGEQYCWSPLELIPGGQYSNFSPGDALGGIETIDPGILFHTNCDGYRLATGTTDWEGLVLTQGSNSDYDLSVHHALAGVKEGFDDFLANSGFPAGATDYVLFNNNILAAGVYDIGVENIEGNENYTIEAVGSTNLPVPVSGRHGPYDMPVSNMLRIFNIYLEQDLYAFRLDNLAGTVDWGMGLHPYDILIQGRHQSETSGTANLNGPGEAEFFTIDIPAAGWYGLAVFKVGPWEFDKEGIFRLTIMQGISDVPDVPDLPITTMMVGIHPNPFNPQTEIFYELVAAAAVELAIYDLKGARVRRLVHESMRAGRHRAVWNGEDDAGQRVASGVYLARFTSGDHRDVKKVVMVK